jgi:hypothetical protein
VLCGGEVVGRIFLSKAGKWMWASYDHEGRAPAYGDEATREAALQALARAWARERSETMTLNDDDVVAWTFNGQRTTCTVRIARLMLGAVHHDWSDERIEQELLVRIEAEGQT